MERHADSDPWIAIRTQPWSEKKVRHYLAHCGVECYLPMLRRVSQWKHRAKVIEWPLFVQYVFAKVSPAQEWSVLQIPGVLELVRHVEGQRPIDDQDVVAIQQMVASGLQVSPSPFLEGAPVEAIRGPLQGFRGRLVRKGDQCRIIRDVEVIGRAAAVDVDQADVAFLDEERSPHLSALR